jgi:hypothetical protein
LKHLAVAYPAQQGSSDGVLLAACYRWGRAVRVLNAPSSSIRDFVKTALPHVSFFQQLGQEQAFAFSAIRDGLCARRCRRGDAEAGDRIGLARMDPLASISTTPDAVLAHRTFALKWQDNFRLRHYELQDCVGDLDYSALPAACNKRFQAIEDHNARLPNTYNITSAPTILVVSSSGLVTWRGTAGWMDAGSEAEQHPDDKFKIKIKPPSPAAAAAEHRGGGDARHDSPPRLDSPTARNRSPASAHPHSPSARDFAEFSATAHKAMQRFLASKLRETDGRPDSPRQSQGGELLLESAEDRAAQVAARLSSAKIGQQKAAPAKAFVLECSSAPEAATKWPWDEQDEQDLQDIARKDEILLARQRREGERATQDEKANTDIMFSGGYQGWRKATVAATLPADDRQTLAMSLRRWCSYTKTTKGG